MKAPDYYPPAPPGVPEALAEPSRLYRRKVNAMLAGVILFFTLYGGLMLLCLIGFLALFTASPITNEGKAMLILGRLLVAPFLLLLFFYLVKNLFKVDRINKDYNVEIFPEDHPRFFDFLEHVCDEADAPFPDEVFVNFEVNASAGQDIGLFSLFTTPRRRLTVGLGLLNVVNLTEFKAVLAHEFGHLSQRSMHFGTFVYLAHKVVRNILFGQDWLDRILASNPVTRPIHWALGKLFYGLFYLVIQLDLALSREMEFHADAVAVSAAGSDAIVSLLYKCLWGEYCLNQLKQDLDEALEQKLVSRDIFLHHREVGKFMRRKKRDPQFGLLPSLPANAAYSLKVFDPDDDETAAMWRDHPSNYDREMEAKDYYIRTRYDERTPWDLFERPETLREKVSQKFYRAVFKISKKATFSDPQAVQTFLDEEYADFVFDPRYGGLYDCRVIEWFDYSTLADVSNRALNAPEGLVTNHLMMFTPAVLRFSRDYHRHMDEADLLHAIVKKWYRPKKNRFKYRGKKYHRREAKKLLEQVEKDLERDKEWLREFDAKVFVTYYELALHLDQEWARELYERYRFHFIMQIFWKQMRAKEGSVYFITDFLGQLESKIVSENWFHVIIEVFREAHKALKDVLEEAKLHHFPNLTNLPAGEAVRPYLLQRSLVDRPTHWDWRLKPTWIRDFISQYREVMRKLSRIHFKSLSSILALQQRIGDRAAQNWAPEITDLEVVDEI